MPRLSARKWLLAGGSAALALLVAEAVLRTSVPVRAAGETLTVYDPLYGTVLKANLSTTVVTPEFRTPFSTNSLGFRGPEPEGELRRPVLFLGDSYTMGYGVADGEEFPELVRRALAEASPAIPVVNAGVGDAGTGRWLRFLQREAERYDPRAVVLQVTVNDFDDNVREGLYRLTSGGGLVARPVPPAGISRRLQSLVDRIPVVRSAHLVGLARELVWRLTRNRPRRRRDTTPQPPRRHSRDALTYRLLEETVALCDRERFPVVSVLVGLAGERRASVAELFTARGLPQVWVPDRHARPDFYYQRDWHWTPAGHRWVAEQVLVALARQGVPPTDVGGASRGDDRP